MKTVVKAVGVKKYFEIKEGIFSQKNYVKAVDDVTISIQQDETYGLVGESGSGKSTLGRLILRLIEPTQGKIYYKDKEITNLPPEELRHLRKKMQIVFQDPYSSLHPKKKILDIVGEPLLIHDKLDKKEIEERVAKMLENVGLTGEHMYRYPHEFSGGQRQRIAIARALILNPEFIVLDEPTSALDVSVQAKILNLLNDIKQKFNLTYLLISHNIAVVDYMSDKIAVMYLGKIVEFGKRDDVIRRPLHPYTRALLSSVPIPDPKIARTRKKIILKGEPPSPLNPPSGCRFRTRCPFAKDECGKKEPVLEDAGNGHFVACHFWREIEEKEPPTLEWVMSKR